MASKTSIANLAIAAHSGDWVDDVDAAQGRTPEAILAVWDTTLEQALAAHPWKFARWTWRDQPALAATENPDPDLAYAYRLPPDCVRVFETRPKFTFDEWENIVTSDTGPALTLIGVRRSVDIGRFSAYFVQYLAKRLALEICTPINASEAIRKRCQEEVAIAFKEATFDNGRAGQVKMPFADSFLAARTRGVFDGRGRR